MTRAISTCLGVCVLAACHGITYPESPVGPAPTVAAAPTIVRIIVDPPLLPAGGGTVTIQVSTLAGEGVAAPAARVELVASAGTLRETVLTTSATGHATTEWTGTTQATITARAGDIDSSATIQVTASETTLPPAPSPGPPPAPAPAPAPTPPNPPPAPPPLPGPAGDLRVTITASPSLAVANQPITFSAALSSVTGALVPAITKYVWDLNNDKIPEPDLGATPSATFTAGTHLVYVSVVTKDNRDVEGTLLLTVHPAAAVTASLSASPSTVAPDETVTLTATASGNVAAGSIVAYDWDFNTASGAAIDRTTTTASTSTSYSTIGSKTVRVTARTANSTSGSATAAVNVTAPALVVGLTVSGTQTAGSSLTFTAKVTPTDSVPSSMTFAWDYNNDGATDEVTTGSSPSEVKHAFNTTGEKTVRVTVTAPDGRTATNTITVTVT